MKILKLTCKYQDIIDCYFELDLFRPYFAIFSLDSAATCLKNGSSGQKIPTFISTNQLCPDT
jgi:hypothetical protein